MKQIPQHSSYQEKLLDKRWLAKRNLILERDDRRCVICGNTENLVVHHKQYHFITRLQKFIDPWDYNDSYLITVCESCHNSGHHKFEVPIKNIN